MNKILISLACALLILQPTMASDDELCSPCHRSPSLRCCPDSRSSGSKHHDHDQHQAPPGEGLGHQHDQEQRGASSSDTPRMQGSELFPNFAPLLEATKEFTKKSGQRFNPGQFDGFIADKPQERRDMKSTAEEFKNLLENEDPALLKEFSVAQKIHWKEAEMTCKECRNRQTVGEGLEIDEDEDFLIKEYFRTQDSETMRKSNIISEFCTGYCGLSSDNEWKSDAELEIDQHQRRTEERLLDHRRRRSILNAIVQAVLTLVYTIGHAMCWIMNMIIAFFRASTSHTAHNPPQTAVNRAAQANQPPGLQEGYPRHIKTE